MKLLGIFKDWRINRRPLHQGQIEAIAELERRPDHLETVAKAGTLGGHLFSMVYVGHEDRATDVAVVYEDGDIRWLPTEFLELDE